MPHHDADFDLRDFFYGQRKDCGDKRVARILGRRWRAVLASKSPEATSVQTVLAGELITIVLHRLLLETKIEESLFDFRYAYRMEFTTSIFKDLDFLLHRELNKF